MNFLRIGICIFLMFCFFQAMFYPFLQSPETEIAWWQIGPLAGIGYVLGFPIFYFGESISPEHSLAFGAIGSMVWTCIIYFCLGFFLSSSKCFWQDKQSIAMQVCTKVLKIRVAADIRLLWQISAASQHAATD